MLRSSKSMQQGESVFYRISIASPTANGWWRDYNKIIQVSDIINPDKHRPQEYAMKGARPMLRCFREEEETRVHVKIYSYIVWIVILSSTDSNGFTSFKINILKQRFSILFLALPCSAHALLCISLSHSDQLSSNCSIIHLFSHSYDKR